MMEMQTIILVAFQVLLIDVVLAGDNAVVIGMAARGLDPSNRRTALLVGIGGAAFLRIVLAAAAAFLLTIEGLSLVGGLMLLYVCWNMWREIRAEEGDEDAEAEVKSLRQAIAAIIIADVSMSLDNVLAVSGAAAGHIPSLVFGLIMSVVLTGVAASAIARLMNRFPWIAYVGLALVFGVACEMIYRGALQIL